MPTTPCKPFAEGSGPLYILLGKFPAAPDQEEFVAKSHNANKVSQRRGWVPATLMASALSAAVPHRSLQEGKMRSN